MNIMSLFQPKAAQAPAAPVTPGNIPANPDTNNANNTPGAEDKTKTPFDQFGELWQNDPNKKAPGTEPIFSVDPQKLQESAGKVDFTKVISPELLQDIQAGGEKASAAFAQGLNKVAQQVYAQSAYASTQLVEQAVQKATENFAAKIPEILKRQQVNANLKDENPLFKHPAIAPLMSAVESQLVAKHPDATTAEIQAMAKDYMSGLGDLFKAKDTSTDTSSAGADDIDWEKVFLTK